MKPCFLIPRKWCVHLKILIFIVKCFNWDTNVPCVINTHTHTHTHTHTCWLFHENRKRAVKDNIWTALQTHIIGTRAHSKTSALWLCCFTVDCFRVNENLQERLRQPKNDSIDSRKSEQLPDQWNTFVQRWHCLLYLSEFTVLPFYPFTRAPDLAKSWPP